MRLRNLVGAGAVVVGILVGVPAAASAITVGRLASAASSGCGSTTAWLIQSGSTTANYTIPSGGGLITSWSTSFGPSGAPVELLVSGPQSGGAFPVVGTDSEVLPTPIPASNISTFNVNPPIVAQANDLLGLVYTGGSNTTCIDTAAAPTDIVADGIGGASAGGSLVPSSSASPALTNAEVNLVQSSDVALTGTASPSAVTTGTNLQLTFQATASPGGAGTFSDTLPSGLQPVFAAAGANPCTVSGQAVSCSLKTLPSTVNIAVRGATAGTYTNTASVASAITDPNPGNNTVSMTVGVVNPPPTPQCTVPKLKNAPLAVAKSVLPLVNCKVGKVTKAKSKSVAKGDVISTNPKGGKKLAAGTKVAIKTSSGKAKKKSKKKK
jgi:hypothetical protein